MCFSGWDNLKSTSKFVQLKTTKKQIIRYSAKFLINFSRKRIIKKWNKRKEILRRWFKLQVWPFYPSHFNSLYLLCTTRELEKNEKWRKLRFYLVRVAKRELKETVRFYLLWLLLSFLISKNNFLGCRICRIRRQPIIEIRFIQRSPRTKSLCRRRRHRLHFPETGCKSHIKPWRRQRPWHN